MTAMMKADNFTAIALACIICIVATTAVISTMTATTTNFRRSQLYSFTLYYLSDNFANTIIISIIVITVIRLLLLPLLLLLLFHHHHHHQHHHLHRRSSSSSSYCISIIIKPMQTACPVASLASRNCISKLSYCPSRSSLHPLISVTATDVDVTTNRRTSQHDAVVDTFSTPQTPNLKQQSLES